MCATIVEGSAAIWRIDTVTQDSSTESISARYASLGLIANPFSVANDSGEAAIEVATRAETNRLLVALNTAAGEDKPKPVAVIKHQVPAQYPLGAVSRAEYALVNDDELNILHAYVPFFLMRNGRVRSTLRVLGERLAFRDFEKTLAAYVGQILSTPDRELDSFVALGQERLDAFAAEYEADSDAATRSVFGEPEVERRPEFSETADLRPVGLETDVAEDEASPELDGSIGEAPGIDAIHAEGAEAGPSDSSALLNYFAEHTREHLSPVIARALRVYNERGLAAMTTELRVTKAPRKTLSALVKFARTRFRKLVLMYDGFGTWANVPSDLRTQIVTSLSEIRWMLDGDAVVVLLLEQGVVPELEEQFSGATRLDWTFAGVRELFDTPDLIDEALIDGWFAAATVPGAAPIDTSDRVVGALLEASAGSLVRFVEMVNATLDSAADRGLASLDDEALQAGLGVESPSGEPS